MIDKTESSIDSRLRCQKKEDKRRTKNLSSMSDPGKNWSSLNSVTINRIASNRIRAVDNPLLVWLFRF